MNLFSIKKFVGIIRLGVTWLLFAYFNIVNSYTKLLCIVFSLELTLSGKKS